MDECLRLIGQEPAMLAQTEMKIADIINKGKNISSHILDEIVGRVN